VSILARIRANGGEVIRDEWRITIKPGRLKPDALAWVQENKADLMAEVWPEWDAFEERAAIMEFDGGMTRSEAEAEAYRRVMQC